MQIPAKISFHNMDPSPALESRIKEKIEKLANRYARLIGCEVIVESSVKHRNKGNPYSLHIRATLPGGEFVVSHHPGRSPKRHEKVFAAMNDAFKAIEKQLDHFRKGQRGEVKTHESIVLKGYVSKIDLEKEYGMITMEDDTEMYFHKNAVKGGRFSDLGLGSRVHFSFIEGEGHEGPQANYVLIVNKEASKA